MRPELNINMNNDTVYHYILNGQRGLCLGEALPEIKEAGGQIGNLGTPEELENGEFSSNTLIN